MHGTPAVNYQAASLMTDLFSRLGGRYGTLTVKGLLRGRSRGHRYGHEQEIIDMNNAIQRCERIWKRKCYKPYAPALQPQECPNRLADQSPGSGTSSPDFPSINWGEVGRDALIGARMVVVGGAIVIVGGAIIALCPWCPVILGPAAM